MRHLLSRNRSFPSSALILSLTLSLGLACVSPVFSAQAQEQAKTREIPVAAWLAFGCW